MYRFTFCKKSRSDYDTVNPIGRIHSNPKRKRLQIRSMHSYATRQQQFEQSLFHLTSQFLVDIHLTRRCHDLAGPGL